MNKHLLLFIVLTLASLSFAGQDGVNGKALNQKYFKHDALKGLKTLESTVSRKLQSEWNKENSTPSIISGRLTAPGYSVSANKSIDGIRFMSENKELFGLSSPEQELKVKSAFTDELSMTHVKYDQMINGIRIFPSQLIVHFNSDGSIESVNGNYIPTPEIITTPKLSGSSAIANAKQSLGKYSSTGESSELIIFRKNLDLRLAYEVKLPSNSFPEMKLIIDANSGEVLDKDSGIRYDGPMVGSGVGLNGIVKPLNTYLFGGHYYLIDATLPMYIAPVDSFKGVVVTYDAKNDTNNGGYQSVSVVNDPNGDNNFNDNEGLKAAVDAHIFAQTVYKYYKSVHNRNSFDNQGGSLINVVHYLINYNNAFWNGQCMSYGDGDGIEFSNLAGALDVIAHELTHGVTGTTANLVYHNQPGAINESMSDCIASCVDSTNWLIGEDVYTPGTAGDGIRSMQDPHNGATQGSEKWQPATLSEYLNLPDTEPGDWGGVHINSGIPNKAFYNVASVTGHYKAGKIWYRALTVYLTNNSQFSDLRASCLNAAKDLFGAASPEYTTVGNGFDNVGITAGTDITTDLIYDDGNPVFYVASSTLNSEYAVKFTPPTNNADIQNVKIFLTGDANTNTGNGHFTLVLYSAVNSLPGSLLITPYSYFPTVTGWQSFDLSSVHVTGEFFVSARYDGSNYPEIGADSPPANGRTYYYVPSTSTWYQALSPNDYLLLMRATVKTTTSVSEIDTRIPDKFELLPNYPNPFNPSTTIRYSLPESADVNIAVYDINGSHITDLADNHQNPGTYTITWNGRNDAGLMVSSGVYYCRVKAGNYIKTNKMILLK